MIEIKAAFLIASGPGVRFESYDYRAGVLSINYEVSGRHYTARAKSKNTTAMPMHRAVRVCAEDARETAYALNGQMASDLADAKQKAGM